MAVTEKIVNDNGQLLERYFRFDIKITLSNTKNKIKINRYYLKGGQEF